MCTLADKNISWLVQEAAIGQVVDLQGMWRPDVCDMCVCVLALFITCQLGDIGGC